MHCHRLLELVIVLLHASGGQTEESGGECVVKDSASRNAPFWTLNVFDDYEYVYGYPPDFIGRVVGTVSVKNLTCDPAKPTDLKSKECTQALGPTYCHFNETILAQFAIDENKVPRCPHNARPESLEMTLNNTKPVQAMQVSEPTKDEIGQYHEERQTKLEEFFEQCAMDCNKLISIAGIWLCDYQKFLELVNGKPISAQTVTWDMSKKNIFG
ncbi:unnamed protein product [Echinostoma caproni]|uniref:Secreted protein n=1 Tax=Echinostoma caproni TaxID=27848 RepID=A0A183ADQ7_9TREM|nr:unnamed protein product [Echinostoma caproni]